MPSREDYSLRVGQAYLDALVAGEPLPGDPTREELVRWLALERAYVTALESRPERVASLPPVVRDAQHLPDEVAEAVERVCEVLCFLLPKGTFTPEHRDEVYRPLADMATITRHLRGEE